MLLSTLPLCLSFTVCQAPQEPGVTEVHSLQHFVARPPDPTLPPWGSLLRRPTDGTRIDLLDCEANTPPFSSEQVVEVLRRLLPEAVEQDRLRLTTSGQSLFVSGTAAEVTKVAERLRAGALQVARSLQVEFAVWDAADRETPAAVLGAADYQRFTGNRDPMWRCVATTRHGVAVTLERIRWSRYVRDVDVEVAQKQTMTNPVTDAYGEGGHAVVRPFALVGTDEFVLHVQFAVAQRRGVVKTLPTGMADAAELELPTLETDYGAFSGRVANGGALAATLRGHPASGGARILTVRVIGRTPPPNPSQGGFAIWPCGALTSQALSRRVLPPDANGQVAETDSGPGHGHIPAEDLLALVRGHLGAAGEGATLQCGHGYLALYADPTVASQCEAFLRALQNRLVRTVTVQHTAALRAAEGERDQAGPLLHELTLPSLFGRDLVAARCLETNVVADVFSEIAQEAGVLDPGVATLQSGSYLLARVGQADDLAHVQFMLDNRHTTTPQARSIMPGGVLMTPEIARTVVNHDGFVANNQALDHGDGPAVNIEGRVFRSMLATAIRW